MEFQGYDMNELVKEAQHRWLKPPEVLFILQNHGNHQLTETSPQKPPSGSLFLFNKRVLRFFRKDGHIWRKKRDGKTVGEAHERLKVGNVDTLNCYYAHGEVNPNFQRRSYWMLDAAYEHIVLVHYREIIEGRHRSGLNSQGSPDLSYSASQSPSLSTARNPSSNSAVSDLCEPYQGSLSPASVEVSSELIKRNIIDQLDGNNGSGDMNSFPEFEVSQALRRLEEQLSLNDDDIEALSPYYGQNNNFEVLNIERTSHQDELAVLKCRGSDESFNDHTGALEDSKSNILQISGDNRNQHLQHVDLEYKIERNESPFWKETLELCANATWMISKEKSSFTSGANENPFYLESERLSAYLTEQPEKRSPQWMDLSGNKEENKYLFGAMSENNLSQRFSAAKQFLLGSCDHIVSPTTSLPLDVVKTEICDGSFGLSTSEVNPEYDTIWFDHVNQAKNPLGTELNSNLAEKQMFSVREISPEHGYAGESTKVIITGYFLCDPSECTWTCMFGDIEVPVQIIQEGVLRCQAPPNVPGKVTLCITSGNRQSCSEVREFEYLLKPGSCDHCNSSEKEHTESTEELLLLVRLTQMLVSDSMPQRSGKVELGISSEDSWEHIIEDLLVGTATPFRTTDLILQELLKDKLQQWLSSKYHEGDAPSYSLSRKEQGIIHMVTGLGFEWALNPLLGSGVCINFRDINGWTALHWAARFGR
ncbi:hypothetical protein IFM89_006499 [Coptis chinensis]|uniref:CG-1 domain-containing protein n=1 Tax=Coptis chinensis TaxID=261450 RepID=A0A835M7I9_9MAGN|nr:hypothetical protein IFM89_006499 [Coptis chinensis]